MAVGAHVVAMRVPLARSVGVHGIAQTNCHAIRDPTATKSALAIGITIRTTPGSITRGGMPKPRRSSPDAAILRRRRAALREVRRKRRDERDKRLAIPKTEPTWEDLTPRQHAVIMLLVVGHTTKATAKMLGLRTRQVREMRDRACRKLGCNLVMLARRAVRECRVPIDSSVEPARYIFWRYDDP